MEKDVAWWKLLCTCWGQNGESKGSLFTSVLGTRVMSTMVWRLTAASYTAACQLVCRFSQYARVRDDILATECRISLSFHHNDLKPSMYKAARFPDRGRYLFRMNE